MNRALEDCDTTCPACGRVWCRDLEVSPGEAEGICADCYDTEDDEG